jgi:prophage tail gpP-like protein
MRNSDEVTLVTNGKEFTGWEGVTIEMAIDALADAFSVSCPYDPTIADLVASIEPYKYQSVQIFIGDDLYLTGTLDAPEFDSTPRDNTLILQGRSKTGILCDCSAAVDTASQAEGLTFHDIANQQAKPLGVTIRDDDLLYASRVISEARAAYGESAFDFLHKIAAPHNLLLNSAYDGRMVITFGDDLVDRPIVADLTEGDSIITNIHTKFDGSKRFSVYQVAGQFAGYPEIYGTAKDPYIAKYRPFCKAGEEIDGSDTENTASRIMSEAIASALSITVDYDGWRRPDGKLWAERQAVTLLSPHAYLNKRAKYIIAGLTLKLDAKNGKTVSHRLVPPEVYSTKLTKKKQKKVDLW